VALHPQAGAGYTDGGYYEVGAGIAFTTAKTLPEKAENAKNTVKIRLTNIYKQFSPKIL